MSEQDNDPTTSEDHFGRHNEGTTWSRTELASVTVIAIIAVTVERSLFFAMRKILVRKNPKRVRLGTVRALGA